jgi:hypothetical protein
MQSRDTLHCYEDVLHSLYLSSGFVLCMCKALSVIDNTVLLAAFLTYCIPSFVCYFYPEVYYSFESRQHLVKAYYYIELVTKVCIDPVWPFAQMASNWVTVLVGVNRYIAVCRPFQVKNVLCRSVYVIDFIRIFVRIFANELSCMCASKIATTELSTKLKCLDIDVE